MRIETVQISQLKEMEGNPRKMSDFEFENLKKNIQEFGYVSPLIVNKDNSIIGGNQRLRVLKELFSPDSWVSVIRLDLPEDKARRLNVSLNRISGAWDFDLLNDFLKKTDAAELAGFTEQELRQISADYNYEDLSKELKDLQLGEMESISWTAKFKNEEDFKKVKETLKRVRISNKLGGFKSDYANGSVMKTLAEEYDELKEPIPGSEDEGNQMQNMEDLKKLCDNYETKHPINRAKLRK